MTPKINTMKLPHWLMVMAACAAGAVPVLASNLPGKWAALAPVFLALAGALKSVLASPPPPPDGGA